MDIEINRQPKLRQKKQPPTPGTKIRTICFICTGNTCRSPMAAAAWNDMARARGIDIRAYSAGLYAAHGEPISAYAAQALGDAGIKPLPGNEYTAHTARRADQALLAGCDMIIGMTGRHTTALIAEFPHLAEKIISMPADILDPWGGDIDDYKKCLEEIQEGIIKLSDFGEERENE